MTEKPADKSAPDPDKQQSDAASELNKPDEARAKGASKSGNILGGVQSEKK